MRKDRDNITILGMATTLDIPPERVFQNAADAELEEAIAIGVVDGKLYFASHTSDVALILFRMEQAKKHIMEMVELESL